MSEIYRNLKALWIYKTCVGGKKGQETELWLAQILSTNTTIETLELMFTDLIGINNVEKWGDALMKNNILTQLCLSGVEEKSKDQLRTKTKN